MRNDYRYRPRSSLCAVHVHAFTLSQSALHGSQGWGRVRHEHLVALITQLQVDVGERLREVAAALSSTVDDDRDR